MELAITKKSWRRQKPTVLGPRRRKRGGAGAPIIICLRRSRFWKQGDQAHNIIGTQYPFIQQKQAGHFDKMLLFFFHKYHAKYQGSTVIFKRSGSGGGVPMPPKQDFVASLLASLFPHLSRLTPPPTHTHTLRPILGTELGRVSIGLEPGRSLSVSCEH